jgi:hypothetical protein
VKEHGELVSLEPLGATSEADGMAAHYRAVFGKTPVTFHAEWKGSQLFTRLRKIDDAHPYRLELAPTGKRHELVARSRNGAATIHVTIKVGKDGKPTGLVWKDSTKDEAEGVVCKRAAQTVR